MSRAVGFVTSLLDLFIIFFFFQAEDGIRDRNVTGVQTCALPIYYRGCWHVVSRSLFYRYCPFSSLSKAVYNPKTFFLHAASLRQSFLHCAIFPTAASRRSLGRISVPMWPFNLSVRLLIVDLVGRYPTNYLIRRKPIYQRIASFPIVPCGT